MSNLGQRKITTPEEFELSELTEPASELVSLTSSAAPFTTTLLCGRYKKQEVANFTGVTQ